MPAYNASNCGQGRNTICSAFYQAAIRASGGMDIADVLKFIADQFAADIEEHKVGHTVWANEDDEYPGTLSQKLAAGTNITLTEGAPSGTVGRAANERVITIAASGAAGDTKIGNVNDGSTNVAPCDKITFSGSGNATVVVADAGSDDATVTVGVSDAAVQSAAGSSTELKHTSRWITVDGDTPARKYISTDDWRGRVVEILGWYNTGVTEANAKDDVWSGGTGDKYYIGSTFDSGGVGDQEYIMESLSGPRVLVVGVENGTGKIYYEVSDSAGGEPDDQVVIEVNGRKLVAASEENSST